MFWFSTKLLVYVYVTSGVTTICGTEALYKSVVHILQGYCEAIHQSTISTCCALFTVERPWLFRGCNFLLSFSKVPMSLEAFREVKKDLRNLVRWNIPRV
ncbi:hypothetical protein EDC04DRAFT_2734458 [Pisolithus marmoratus]|nr:hypothetical protein EDC04DRAFT_2734458 [Pisolithus marmoratus]